MERGNVAPYHNDQIVQVVAGRISRGSFHGEETEMSCNGIYLVGSCLLLPMMISRRVTDIQQRTLNLFFSKAYNNDPCQQAKNRKVFLLTSVILRRKKNQTVPFLFKL